MFCAEVMSIAKDAIPLYSKVEATNTRNKDANKLVSSTIK